MQLNEESRSLDIGLIQINNSFSDQNYLPLSVGMLQAYAETHAKDPRSLRFRLPIYRRIPVVDAVEQLRGVDIAFFSTYVWNFRTSLEIARLLKDENPLAKVAFGGPHVPEQSENFLRKYPFIDITCHGEGEQTGLMILENAVVGDWDEISGISYINDQGKFVKNAKADRLENLSYAPSPYLAGVFEGLMEANPTEHWIGLWETNRGCPFSCTFCDWGSAVQSKVHSFDMDRLRGELDWFAQQKVEYIFCCDANFGILPRDLDLAKYAAQVKGKYGYPHALSVQNTKNATERAYETQKILSDAGLNRGVDIAVQSIDQMTLQNIRRNNISLDTYEELQRRFTKDGVDTYTDMIMGLPGETYSSFANGVSTIIENGQHNRIQFNNLSILPNAEMGDPDYQKEHGLVTVESKIINIHGTLAESEGEIYESQDLVIGSKSMPEPDWVRSRAFAWMVSLLHFDKVLQIPMVLIHENCSLAYRDLIEAFTEKTHKPGSVLEQIQTLMEEQGRTIQSGGPEYMRSEDWLNIWWFVDEYVLIKLVVENKLHEFYVEADNVLAQLLEDRNVVLPVDLLHESIQLNESLIKLPFQTETLSLQLSYNIWEYYRSILIQGEVDLEKIDSVYHIDRVTRTWQTWDDWLREVIWFGNKKGAYLYGNESVESQLAGHF